jgi:hypothetical protein
MNETAAHVVDSVIPKVPTRQWVISVPAPLRHLISFDSQALKLVLDAYNVAVFSWLKNAAKKEESSKKQSRHILVLSLSFNDSVLHSTLTLIFTASSLMASTPKMRGASSLFIGFQGQHWLK